MGQKRRKAKAEVEAPRDAAPRGDEARVRDEARARKATAGQRRSYPDLRPKAVLVLPPREERGARLGSPPKPLKSDNAALNPKEAPNADPTVQHENEKYENM